MKTKIFRKNRTLLLCVSLLLMISLLNMYGASFISPLYKSALFKQAIWIVLGILAFLLVYIIDMKLFYRYSILIYVICNILLLAVLFFGRNVNGASSWFKIGSISIQPSEIFKPFFIIFLAHMIDKNRSGSFTLLLKILIFTLMPCILIFLEPDTGVVIMYLLIAFGEVLTSKVHKKQLMLIFGIFALALASFLALYFLKQDLFIKIFGTGFFYRMDRLLTFTNNSSYQLTNALIGIGASGISGLGITSSKIYIPEVTTDFVFDLSILNFGYIVGFLIVIIYVYILFKIYRMMVENKKYVSKCILSGVFWMMLFQVVEHIFMNLGITPITGITLPFLSYGGSSIVSYFIILSFVLKLDTIKRA